MWLPYLCGAGDRAVERAEEDLRPSYGTGHYSAEQWSQHHHYRRGQAFAAAVLRARVAALRAMPRAAACVEFIENWRRLSSYRWPLPTAEMELALLDALSRAARDHTADGIRHGLAAVFAPLLGGGGYAFAVTNLGATDPTAHECNYLVQVYSPLRSTDLVTQQLLRWYLWRVTPAHVECWVEWPDEGIAEALLTEEE